MPEPPQRALPELCAVHQRRDQGLNARIDALDRKVHAKIDELDGKIDEEIGALDAKLSRRIDVLGEKVDAVVAGQQRMAGSMNVPVSMAQWHAPAVGDRKRGIFQV